MKRIERKRREALARVMAVVDVLTFDTLLAHEHLAEAANSYTPKSAFDWDMAFTAKTAVRALFAHIEGVSQVMRVTVADYAQECGVPLSPKERLELEEKRVTSTGIVVDLKLTPTEGLKLAARRFPTLFGISFPLPLQASEWQALTALEKVRRELTHPKTLDHLAARETLVYWLPSLSGYLVASWNLLAACARAIGVEPKPLELPRQPYKYQPRQAPTFSAEDHDFIAAHPLRMLEYARVGLGELIQDTTRATSLCTRMSQLDSLLGKHGQFGLRNLARTVVSELEGTLAISKLFVLSSHRRGEIELTPSELVAFDAPSTMGALLAVSDVWSREFWKGEPVAEDPSLGRKAVRGIAVRDQLTHPKSAKQLEVSLADMEFIMAVSHWLRAATRGQYVGESWVEKANVSTA